MKIRKIIWPAVLICCIALGVWQKHNISVFWREYHALWRDYDYDYHLHKPLIPEKVARTDPEAVADMRLRYDWGEGGRLSALAEKLLKFPDNEFLLFSCASEIYGLNELDQKIGVTLTEKLIDLDKDNALYHYLKAAALLANRQDGDITPVLDEINTAAACPNFYFPYSKYSQRAVAVAERAKLHSALVEALSSQHLWFPGAHDIHRSLLLYAHRAFTDGEIAKGLLIDDAIYSIGKNQLDAGYNEASRIQYSNYMIQIFYFGHWSSPEILELQRADITEQRARQNRLQLCPYVLPRIKSEEVEKPKDSDLNKEPRVTDEQMILNVTSAMHNFRMLFAIGGVWLVLVAICMVRGWSGNQRTGITSLLLFGAVSLCYFFVINGLFLSVISEVREWGTCIISHIDIMRPYHFGWEQIYDFLTELLTNLLTGLPPIYSFLLLAFPVLAAILLWVVSRSRLRKMSFWPRILLILTLAIVTSAITATLFGAIMYFEEEWLYLRETATLFIFIFVFALAIAFFASWFFKLRLVKTILVILPLGILTILMSPYAYISQIPLVLFVIICTLMVLNKPSEPIPFIKALRGIFSRGDESAAIRSRAVKMLAIFLVIHWLIFTASVPTCSRYIDRLYSSRPRSYPKSTLAPADETSYQRVLAMFDSNYSTVDDFCRLIPLVMPQDLPSVLNMYKGMSFAPSYPYKSSDINASSSEDHQRKIERKDWGIINVMQGCGRDAVNILADAMDNPELEFALVRRGKLGDIRVKAKLEELLDSRIANGEPPEPNKHSRHLDRTVKTIDIICALACISEPNEAGARFLDYVARGDMSQLKEEDKFFWGIPLLPTIQAREVIKAYLAKTQDWQPPERVRFDGEIFREDVRVVLRAVRETAGTYADRDISQAVLKIMLRSEDSDIIKDWDGPWEAPRDFDMQSADLLRKGLSSKNEQLRAWCVWQLRKVGYQFSKDEMSRLLADESWKVRANAVIAGDRKTAERAAKDADPFVRWVASLRDGEEN